jgi:foldase protein PrsA
MRETIRRMPLVLLALLATWILATGCTSDPDSAPSPIVKESESPPSQTNTNEDVVATIGEVSLSRDQLMQRLLSDYGAQTLRSMMLTEAVKKEAESLRIEVSEEELEQELTLMRQGYEDEDQYYAAMQEQLGMNREELREDTRYRLLLEKLSIRNVVVTDFEIDQYLEEHQEELQPKKQYQLSQIVVTKKEEAEKLLDQLVEGAEFSTLAKQYSEDDFTADSGGDLGWVEDHDPFEDPGVLEAAASLQVGGISGPIKTEQGYTLIQLNGRNTTNAKSEEAVRMEVRRQLALGKADSMSDMEQALLKKYQGLVLDPSLRS